MSSLSSSEDGLTVSSLKFSSKTAMSSVKKLLIKCNNITTTILLSSTTNRRKIIIIVIHRTSDIKLLIIISTYLPMVSIVIGTPHSKYYNRKMINDYDD